MCDIRDLDQLLFFNLFAALSFLQNDSEKGGASPTSTYGVNLSLT